jgi:hypothetical protein
LSGLAGTVAICAELIVAPPLGSPISLAGIFRFTKSAQLTAALAGHAAAISIAAVVLTSAVFNLNMGSPPQYIGIGIAIWNAGKLRALPDIFL